MDKFEQYKLNLSEKEKSLVLDYLEKVKAFVDKYNIEKELYNDIEDMVFEKISSEKNLDQIKIIKILNEVGEPNIIFSDYVSDFDKNEEKNKLNDKLFFENLIKNGWVRDNENAIFLGISKTLAEKIGISVLLVRISLFLLIFIGGISIWFYILAGIILPVKGIDYSGKNALGYLKMQTIKAIKDGIYNLSKSSIKNILPIFRVLFFGTISIIFLSVLLIFIVFGAIYFTSFSFGEVDFIGTFFNLTLPPFFILWIIFGIIFLSIFTVFSIVYAFTKKIINKYILIIGGISFLASAFFGASTGLDLVQKYSNINENTQTLQLDLKNTGSGDLNINIDGIFLENSYLSFLYSGKNHNFDYNFNVDYFDGEIKLENSTGSIFKAEIKNSVYGNNEISSKFFDGLSKIIIKNDKNNITLNSENNKLFSKKVPFSILERKLILYIPNGYKFKISNGNSFYIKNLFLENKYKKYEDFASKICKDMEISYSKDENKFICNLNEDGLKGIKKEYFQNYIVKNFENISPLKHKNQNEDSYDYDDNGYKNWNFSNFKWENDEKVNFDFGDEGLDLNASLNIKDSNSGILVKDFKIKNVKKINDDFDEEYYEDLNAIKDFNLNFE